MLSTRESRVVAGKCIVLDPDAEQDCRRKNSLPGSSSAKKCQSGGCVDGKCEEVIEITDYNFNSLTNTVNECSTKRTTIGGPSGTSTIRKSLNVTNFNSCLHKFAARLDKKGKLYQMLNNTKGCKVCPTNMESLIARNLSKKYITSKDSYNLKVINDIIYNENSHIVALFKEYLIYDDISEFLKRFYKSTETFPRLHKVNDYYAKYSKVFPNYFLFKESKYMFKNIKRKQRWIDEQQKINSEAQRKPTEEAEDQLLFTTNCMQEINKTDSILGKSQRIPEQKEAETKIQSYLRSQESIKGGHVSRDPAAAKCTRVEEMELQELVERFILKDSISVINISSALGEKDVPRKVPESRPKLAMEQTKKKLLVQKETSSSRPTSRPRNLPSKEAWAEPASKENSLHRVGAHPTRAASVALANIPKQLASTSSKGGVPQFAEFTAEKPGTVRSRSQDKNAAGNRVVPPAPKEPPKKVPADLCKVTSGTAMGAMSTKASEGTKRSRSSNGSKAGTHSRNPHLEKQGAKCYGTNAPKIAKPVEGLATARSTGARAKTTSQTPRTSLGTEKKPVITRQSSVSKNQPQSNMQKAINCFLSKGANLKPSHDVQKDSGAAAKLKNLKGVAIDLEATNQKLQKHLPVTQPQKPKTENPTPGHSRKYKSDYLNSLMNSNNNQNVPTTLLAKPKSELRTPPDLASRLSVPLGSVLRADSALGVYTSSHAMARPTLAAKDENKRVTVGTTKNAGKPQIGGRAKGGQSRIPYL